MGTNRWKQAFDKITISDNDKEELWDQLEQRITGQPARRPALRMAVMIVVILCAGMGVTLAVDGMNGGRLVNALSGIWKAEKNEVDKNSGQIVQKVTDYYYFELDSVYAPELAECSDTRIVFANSFGLVIYDRQQQCVTGTIDLQKIQCNYFNAHTLQTRLLLDGDQLMVYNLSGKKVSGDCYIFDLDSCKDKENGVVGLEPVETKTASAKLEKRWKKQKKNRILTWENYSKKKELDEKIFSEYSLQWETEEHIKYKSFLVVEGAEVKGDPTESRQQLVMYHQCLDTKEISKEKLYIQIIGDGKSAAKELPAYQYQGKDPIRKALADCFASDLSWYEGQTKNGRRIDYHIREDEELRDVSVPLIDIVDVKKGKKYTKVYGTFRWADYSLAGNTLYAAGEGGGIGVAYLQKTADGYKVKKILHPRDGAYLTGDLREFCGGDEKLAAKIMDSESDLTKLSVNVLKEYVKQNDLDIQYMKEYGWDPEKIS